MPRTLPRGTCTSQAFFFVEGQSTVTADLGYGIVIDVRQAHAAFLQEYGLSAAEVPLLHYRCSGQEADPPKGEDRFVDVSE